MQILVIYGNPKTGGFVHSCRDRAADRLAGKGADVDRLRLADVDLRDCVGCFQCLRTGACSIPDDGPVILERLRRADGLVTGASVRNSYFPALYKRFIERTTYILGFGRELEGKPVLAVGAVGMASGRKHLGRVLAPRDFHALRVGYLFFRTGIPTRLRGEDVADRLDAAVDLLYDKIAAHAPLPVLARISAGIDNLVIRKFMLERNGDHVYDYIVERWREKGWMRRR